MSAQSTEAFELVTASNDQTFMSLAKLDHVLWKVNTYLSVIAGEPTFPFVDCHDCRLGKWYYEGEGQDAFSTTSSYASLEPPHARVHDATRRIFDLLGTEIRSDDDEISQALEEMERASDGVLQHLDQMLREKHGS